VSRDTKKPRRAPFQPNLPRLIAFVAVLVLALTAVVVRLAQLQLVQGSTFAEEARANQIRRVPVAAPRGRMFDRNGVTVVRSRPSFTCALIPSDVHDINAVLRELHAQLAIPEATLRRRLLHHRGVNYDNFEQVADAEPYGPVILASDLTNVQMAKIAEAHLSGVDIEAQPIRNYPYGGWASHALGYVGQITEDEYQRLKGKGYTPNDVVGKEGLEVEYDSWLRGKAGGEQIEVDAQGQLVRRLGPVDPIPGHSLELSLDWRLQQIAERALHAQLESVGKLRHRRVAGAVVAIDPRDGGVLALVSQPNFDPNDFADGISEKKYSAYLNDPLEALYDRAIAAATATGSTFKMVTGSGAISAGVVGVDQRLYDSGQWDCKGHLFRDIASGGLGSTTFVPALAASSDGYFYQLADRLGHERLRYYALQYGLGKRSGIDLPGEYAGNWPTNAWMKKYYGEPLYPADVCSLGIGQGAMQATPLQMANATAAVANGGTLYRPHLVYAIRDPAGKIVKRFDHEVIRKVDVTQEAIRAVRSGMDKVTDAGGTAYGLAIPGLPFGGKTGTVETAGGAGPNTTWFVAYAPSDHPRLALAVFMDRTGGYGASVAAPVAREIISAYLGKPSPKPSPTAGPSTAPSAGPSAPANVPAAAPAAAPAAGASPFAAPTARATAKAAGVAGPAAQLTVPASVHSAAPLAASPRPAAR
jgi:penicillin-binding protein 2